MVNSKNYISKITGYLYIHTFYFFFSLLSTAFLSISFTSIYFLFATHFRGCVLPIGPELLARSQGHTYQSTILTTTNYQT